MEIHWYLVPMEGRIPSINPQQRSTTSYDFLRQPATAIDYNGYSGALLATGAGRQDAWTLGASLIPVTQRMKFIVAQHPGITSPLMLAQQAATFDRFSNGA
jgi:alkanesulfonate monooxygenase